jgi:hypothetical protein
MTRTVASHAEAHAVVQELAAAHGGLPVFWGTGYPIERPHVLAVARHFEVRVTVYPTGERYLDTSQFHHLILVDYARRPR